MSIPVESLGHEHLMWAYHIVVGEVGTEELPKMRLTQDD
jgi:hypothetical protein